MLQIKSLHFKILRILIVQMSIFVAVVIAVHGVPQVELFVGQVEVAAQLSIGG